MGGMKKKKKQSKRKQKIDVVLESLLNLEQKVKELTKKVEQLQYSQPYYPNPNLPAPQSPPKYWPVDYPKYKDVTWDAIDKGLQ
ncbi:hypothetical protein EBZ38_11335 [bacterium]|nr:hypothetical protein [bacterium]NDD84844.1 hypothetical protein [bacterium]